MNGTIEAGFIGKVGQDLEPKTSAAGELWTRLSPALGQGEETQWVSVAVFGETAQHPCGALHKGDDLYVEGALRLSEWIGRDYEKRNALQAATWKAEKLGAIGRNKPRRYPRNGTRSVEPNPAGSPPCLEA